jgi:hypothetical protein
MTTLERIRKQARKRAQEGFPSFLVHVSKKVMSDATAEFFGDARPETPRLELSWYPDNIMVERTQYLEGRTMEWAEVTKSEYEDLNK